jgi:hypothetical protein
MITRGRGVDFARAKELLAAATATAERLGMAALLQRLRAAVQHLEQRRCHSPSRTRFPPSWNINGSEPPNLPLFELAVSGDD